MIVSLSAWPHPNPPSQAGEGVRRASGGRVGVQGDGELSAIRRLYRNARLLDPASGLDTPGDLLVDGDRIGAIGGVR